jgi:acyl-CoA synthetase (AMP-forming)/AMP-acid ligase II
MSTTAELTRAATYTRAETIGQMLAERAKGPLGEDIRFLFVNADDVPPERAPQGPDECVTLSFADALDLAHRAAFHLRARGVKQGDRVLLVLPTGPSFLAAFYGCQVLGAIPVPVVPPTSLARMDDHIARIARVASICEATAVVVSAQLLAITGLVRSRFKEARAALSNVVFGQDLLREEGRVTDHAVVSPEAPAMLQFTSGSTGDPKGVILPHRSLLANMRGIGLAAGFTLDDVAIAWLPLFHDMGLIGHFLASVAWGLPLVLMPPEMFIKRPREWLKAISKYRGTCSAAPNFAYSLCAKKIKDRDLEGIDLSTWRVAFCGAEPVNPCTITDFVTRFEPHGFQSTTFFPVYGMAELSLAATFPPAGTPPRFDRIRRHDFEQTGKAEPLGDVDSEAADSVTWVSVGRPLPAHEVRVVDANGRRVGERRQGEIEVRGPSMMAGYYRSAAATAEAIRDGWLRTGDLGYIADGDLFVTGRRKEIIIKSGKNLYPQDIEAAAAKVQGIRVGCCAAFGVSNPGRGTEDLVLVCETRLEDAQERARLMSEVRTAVLEAIGATPDVVVLVGPGTVPKTSSGKIQRDLMRKRYVAGDMKAGAASLMTKVRLKVAQTLERVRTGSILPAALRRRR